MKTKSLILKYFHQKDIQKAITLLPFNYNMFNIYIHQNIEVKKGKDTFCKPISRLV